ncbi:hypothetical protein H0H93_009096 [Arthromyces matolae]|nr:hypothetical protein H0H93_009096 [Arthromyces matolae]
MNYAVGLLLISPLGDLIRRRPLLILLLTLSTSLSIGLAVTKSLAAFEALSFLVGMTSVTPQVLLPLAADLAPPERRASAISNVLSGLLFGILIARVLSGVIAEFTTWRVVYYMAIGTQAAVLVGLYLSIPDYPAKNKNMTYRGILWSMAKFCVTEPLLIQGSLINLASSACFSSFWVTLTFLLGGPPYNYSTLVIGLFGLVGMFGVAMGPFVGKAVDRLVIWYASLIGIIFVICFQAIQTGSGGINIGTVIVATIDPNARARLNAIMILSIFIGQVMGTSVGTRVFVAYGWRMASILNMAWSGFQLVILLLRGPHCNRFTWFGYEGGWEARKSVVDARNRSSQGDEDNNFVSGGAKEILKQEEPLSSEAR